MIITRYWFCALALVAGSALVGAQPPPVTHHADEPLLPTGVSRQDVALSGSLVHLWKDTDGRDVVHFVGEFSLDIGRTHLQSREAVLWMSSRSVNDLSYRRFEVYLWREARVAEPAGTVTTGPVLFVTLNASGDVRLSADATTDASSEDTPVYAEASAIRDRFAGGAPGPVPTGSPIRVGVPGVSGNEVPPVPPAVGYHADQLSTGRIDGQQTITAIGNVYVFQGTADSAEFFELRADAAVLFMRAATEDGAAPRGLDLNEGSPPTDAENTTGSGTEPPDVTAIGGSADSPVSLAGPIGQGLTGTDVQGVYLEGDVVLSRGPGMIRASRLYYDFENDRALILDAVASGPAPRRNIPMYLRADRIRQLSRTEFVGINTRLTTSEFYTPHYHVGASRIEVTSRPGLRVDEVATGPVSGSYKMENVTFNLGGVPLLWWPGMRGEFGEGESALTGLKAGFSDDFGASLETEWKLFNLLGLTEPKGLDATLRLDYFSKRGPAVGLEGEYETDTSFGLFRGYYVRDSGEDNLGRLRDDEPETENRGRATIRHRQYLPGDWELTLEASYISDRNFLEEYFEPEFDRGKEQETLIYLKKQRDDWALTLLGQWRILDFLTQTEHFPELGFRLIGRSLADRFTLFSENRAGFVRLRAQDQTLRELLFLGAAPDSSGTTARADSRQEIEVPFDLGPLRLVAFGSIRGTAWDDSPEQGGIGRVLGTYGLRGSMYLSRVFPNVRSDLWDIDGLRHVIKADITAFAAHTNRDSHELFAFTESVEEIDEIDGASIGVRQRWQTKRGPPDARQTVDVLTWDLEAGFFNDAPGRESAAGFFNSAPERESATGFFRGAPSNEFTAGFTSFSRPENSIARNYVNNSLIWRINSSTALLSEANYDVNDGEVDVFDFALAVDRSPRLSYLIGYRYIEEIDSNLLGFGTNYRISEKYTVAVQELFDLERGETLDFRVGFIRKFPRWYVSLVFEFDNAVDDTSLALSAWPEGAPGLTVGAGRLTGLATATRLQPE